MPNPLKDFLGILRNNHYITESARSAQRKFGEFWTKERLPEGGTEMYTPHVNRPILIGNKHEEGGKINKFKSKLHK